MRTIRRAVTGLLGVLALTGLGFERIEPIAKASYAQAQGVPKPPPQGVPKPPPPKGPITNGDKPERPKPPKPRPPKPKPKGNGDRPSR
jgi:hypothetical protein